MDAWIDRLADALDEERLAQGEIGAVLKLAREVAHGVERKLAPLSTFVAGVHAGRLSASGVPRQEALQQAISVAAGLIPGEADEDPG